MNMEIPKASRSHRGKKRKEAPNGERYVLGASDEVTRRQYQLWLNRRRCDITLIVGDDETSIPAHSTVLAGWSEVCTRGMIAI